MLRTTCLTLLVFVTAAQSSHAATNEWEKLWGPLPQDFNAHYLSDAKKLKRAIDKKNSTNLSALSKHGEWRDYALFELAQLQLKTNQFRAARQSLLTLLNELPESPLEDRARDLLPSFEIALAQDVLKHNNKSDEAFALFRAAFSRLPSKRWVENETALRAWNSLYQKKDPLLANAFVAELVNVLPSDSLLRKELTEHETQQKLPRTRSLRFASDVKPIYPDQQLIDDGMNLVLQERWQGALDKFNQFENDYPDSEQMDRAWYWQARCLRQLGRDVDSKAKFTTILDKYPLSYYGLQAALHLEKPLAQLWSPKAPAPEMMSGTLLPRQWRALWRTRALVQVGLSAQAREEAEYLFSQRPAGTTLGQETAGASLSLARLYFASTYYLGAFTQFFSAVIADKSVLNPDNLDLLFPQPFSDEISKAAQEYELDPLVVLSLTKQESAFVPDAISRSDALGLMQLIMPTAKEVDPALTRELLNNPGTNVRAGSAYLRKLLDRFQGNLALALAGYNAGPHRAEQWQKKLLESPTMKKEFQVDIFIDTIPFTETRRYVGSILRNLAWYRVLQKQELPRTVQELALQWRKQIPTSKP